MIMALPHSTSHNVYQLFIQHTSLLPPSDAANNHTPQCDKCGEEPVQVDGLPVKRQWGGISLTPDKIEQFRLAMVTLRYRTVMVPTVATL